MATEGNQAQVFETAQLLGLDFAFRRLVLGFLPSASLRTLRPPAGHPFDFDEEAGGRRPVHGRAWRRLRAPELEARALGLPIPKFDNYLLKI